MRLVGLCLLVVGCGQTVRPDVVPPTSDARASDHALTDETSDLGLSLTDVGGARSGVDASVGFDTPFGLDALVAHDVAMDAVDDRDSSLADLDGNLIGPEVAVSDAGAIDADTSPYTWPDGTLPPPRYRRYRVETAEFNDRTDTPGRTPRLPDSPWPFDAGALPRRYMYGNGILTLAPDHLSFAFGTTISADFNFYPAIPPTNGFVSAGHFGYTIPLTVTRFEPGFFGYYYLDAPNDGGTFSVQAEVAPYPGRVSLVTRDLRTSVYLVAEADNEVPYRRTVSSRGIVWQRGRIGRLRAPRAALRWDLPGAGRFAMTHDTTLRFGGEPLSSSFLVLIGGPPDAALRGVVGGVEVASAYVLVYDDLNGDGRFEETEDTVLTQSPIGIAWRGAGAVSSDLARSPFSDLIEGWETVRYQRDEARGGWCVAPFDNREQPALDAVVEESFTSVVIDIH
jgi:hypothetical protein